MSNVSALIGNLSAEKRALLDLLLKKEGINLKRTVIVPRDKNAGPPPLSFAQQRLWFLDQMEPGTSTYNIPSGMWLGAGLDIGALERSISQVVARHEVLRTTFSSIDGKPLQVIEAPHPVELPVIDLSSLHEGSRQREAAEVVREEANRGFDLEAGPLLRAKLITEGENRHALLLTMHHIISDGWSMQVLMKEVGELYEGNIRGEESKLKELEIQYADYAMWQREWLSGEVMERELGYWKKHLEGAPAVLEMPTDRVRAAMKSTRGGMVEVRLSKEVSDKLRRLSRQEGATMYMALLAVYKMMLARYSGKRDIVVGTPVAGRNRVETEGLIGFFVNTLALRTEVEGERSYREMLRKVKEVVLEGQGHQEVPFEKLVEEMSPERSLSYTPVFQVMFAVNNIDQTGRGETGGESGGARGAERWSEERDAKFDLTLSMRDTGGGEIEGMVEYSADLYDEETIRRMGSHYERLLESAVENPDRKVCELEMMREEEKKMIVEEWNETRRAYERDKSISEMVENQAAVLPEAIAVVSGKQRLTYDELNRRANQLGRYLRERGVGPEHRVGICVERSIEMVVGLLGILKAGGAYVPMDPAYPKQRLEYMAEDAGISLLLTQETLLPQRGGSADGADRQPEVVYLDKDWEVIQHESEDNLNVDINPENPAYIIYTSGSTGRPKGVVIPHRGIRNHMSWMDDVHPLTASDRVFQKTTFGFDASVWEFFAPLLSGARLVLAEPRWQSDSSDLVKAIIDNRITILQVVPSLLRMLLENGIENCTSLKRVYCGGEALTQELKDLFFIKLDAKLYNLYGPTEATIDSTMSVCDPTDASNSVPIGKPISNTEAYVLDKHMQPVPVGVPGELYVGGLSLARGYLNRPELTAEKFIPNQFSKQAGGRLYCTGDLAKYRADSEIEYLGRIDQQVKIRGYRIELGEIEAALRQHRSIKDAVVIAQERDGSQRLVCYVVEEAGGEGQEEEVTRVALKSYLRERLPEYMVPSVIVKLEEMPLTANGKIDRKALPEAEGGREEGSRYVEARNEMERELVEIWREVLKVEEIGVEDNFFDLGGHSLLATQIISRVRAVFQVEVSLRILFQAPTIDAFALEIQRLDQSQLKDVDEIARTLEQLEGLSEDEVRAFLEEMSIGGGLR